MKIDLTNKNVLLTGSSRGIGSGIAKQLGKAGARVALHYNSNKTEAEILADEIGNGSFTIQANLNDLNEVKTLFDQSLNKMGKIDVLINNAGIAIKSPTEKTDEDWIQDLENTLKINLIASSLLCKKAINHFMDSRGGIIINISSRAANRGDTGDYMAYAASKGGLSSLTKSIAREYGKFGITAFNIAPGFVNTDMAAQFIKEYGEEYVINDLALSRITEPDDLAPLVTFIASGLAEHSTGSTFDVNAGSYMR